MKEVTVKYRKGLPTEKCLNELIDAFFIKGNKPRVPQSYKFSGHIIWDRGGINEKIPSFVDFITDNAIEVKDYHLYDSPSVGHIYIRKHTTQ